METARDLTYTLSDAAERKFGFIVLEIIFFATAGTIAVLHPVTIELKYLPIFFLAVFRMARTISFNEIAEPLRAPFTRTQKDSCGAGDNVHPKGEGIFYVIGSLLACPICSGQWSALILYALYAFAPNVGLTFAFLFGLAGGSEIFHWGAETLEWSGRAFRVISGAVSPDEE